MLENEYVALKERFQVDGCLILRQFISSPALFKEAENRTYALLAEGDVKRNDRFLTGEFGDLFTSIARSQDLIQLATVLLGDKNIALYMNRLLIKDSQWSGEVGIHQDSPYFHGSDHKVTMFIPWTPMQATDGNGGLVFVRGSHKFGRLMRGRIEAKRFGQLEEYVEDFAPTDVIVMDFNTWHYSRAAVDPQPRIIQQVVYQPSSDGSFAGRDLGVPEPTLLTGSWQTSYFSPLDCVVAD